MISRKARIENSKITILEHIDYFWMDFKEHYLFPILFGIFIGTAPFIPRIVRFFLEQ